ncbi:phosphatidate cytidylyltransferase [Nitrosovibrio sp. Nv4]|uniref:phosphatidate cytidylyltransferase n=1 Tax=Nitrosovibrio sp. Nv4 TaxID=1945880 RepID=UPI000BD74B17|nr:phosphatidate cytidylyltransferase [Nitrosovibrio sp. Nv4]SOD40858.1 phosphatidate cytidylyltransferase [Nitrosovibrio sp. Nv4]
MLRARIFTAVIMLCVFLAALFYLSAIFWMVLLLALTATGTWEWSRLAKFSLTSSITYLLFTIILVGELLFLLSDVVLANPHTTAFLGFYAASFAFWTLGVPFFLKSKTPIRNPVALALTGWVLLLPTCFALYQLRAIDPFILLGFMSTIWISDTAAYFTGRKWGKHKLAPGISPGKTWEGVAGALAAVFIYALIWNYGAGDEARIRLLIPLLLLLAIMGIAGDLFESLMKRHAGVKDSGNILPGHGGILDRIDALTSALPIAVLSLLLLQTEL